LHRNTSNRLDLPALKKLTQDLRCEVLDMTTRHAGHASSCFSSIEIMTVLYFAGILNFRPNEPQWLDRDRFILSKGHAAPLLYAVLAYAGYFDKKELVQFREIHTGFHGHPLQNCKPGVEVTSGSLGQGLSFGLGQILAGRVLNKDYHVYTLLGDGECQEGQIWEAAMAASHYKASRLTAIVDHNKYQQNGPITREMDLTPFSEKWRAFGWNVLEVDGHNMTELLEAFFKVKLVTEQPSVIIAHTVKGKGVSFVEADYTFHGRPLTVEQRKKAKEEILCK
jgi:transketolase